MEDLFVIDLDTDLDIYAIIASEPNELTVFASDVWNYTEKIEIQNDSIYSRGFFSNKGVLNASVQSDSSLVAVGFSGFIHQKPKNSLEWKFIGLPSTGILRNYYQDENINIAVGGVSLENGWICNLDKNLELIAKEEMDFEIRDIEKIGNHYFAAGFGKMISTRTDTIDWVNTGIDGDHFIDLYRINQNQAYLLGNRGSLYHSQNGGLEWSKVKTNLNTGLNKLCFITDKIAYIIGDKGLLMRSADQAKTWQEIDLATDHDLLDMNLLGPDLYVSGKSGYLVVLKNVL